MKRKRGNGGISDDSKQRRVEMPRTGEVRWRRGGNSDPITGYCKTTARDAQRLPASPGPLAPPLVGPFQSFGVPPLAVSAYLSASHSEKLL